MHLIGWCTFSTICKINVFCVYNFDLLYLQGRFQKHDTYVRLQMEHCVSSQSRAIWPRASHNFPSSWRVASSPLAFMLFRENEQKRTSPKTSCIVLYECLRTTKTPFIRKHWQISKPPKNERSLPFRRKSSLQKGLSTSLDPCFLSPSFSSSSFLSMSFLQTPHPCFIQAN